MASYSQHKNLELPASPEHYDIGVFNKNAIVIDSELHKLDLKNESQDKLLATKESLNSEIARAALKEDNILNSLSSEIERAICAENILDNNISDEVSRAAFAEGTISESLHTHLSDESNPHKLTKEQLELGNVDNTSDMNKPVSTAQQNALNSALSTHNTSDSSHNDIRLLISELTTRLNALADSDDTTLDQLSEIVAYIKNNKSLIDGITTSKVNVSDIIDNLTSSSADKVLSSKQGMILKGLITDLTTLVGNKVDKVSGKGLSTNDYTTAEKNKLSGVVSGTGQANKVWKTDANGNPGWRDETAISGSLIMNEVKLNDGKNNVTVLKAYDDGDTYNYGSELIVGGNGNTFIGAGESHSGLRHILQEGQRLPGELYDKTAERMYIGSDNEIIMYSNCQTMSNRKAIVFDSSGSLRPLANKTMSIGKSNFAFENVYVDKISSAKQTTTHLAGNQGDVIINSTAAAGAYTILDKLNSTNGYFTDGVYGKERNFYYTAKSTVDGNVNSITKALTLLDESGNSKFPGSITAPSFLGNASSATKAVQDGNGKVIKDTYATWVWCERNIRTRLEHYCNAYFYLRPGESLRLSMEYDDGTIHPYGQALLVISSRNPNTGAFFGASARLLTTPHKPNAGNVSIVSLGTTSNTGYSLTAGNEYVDIKAGANYKVEGVVYGLIKNGYEGWKGDITS